MTATDPEAREAMRAHAWFSDEEGTTCARCDVRRLSTAADADCCSLAEAA